jgi:hypothetical protein
MTTPGGTKIICTNEPAEPRPSRLLLNVRPENFFSKKVDAAPMMVCPPMTYLRHRSARTFDLAQGGHPLHR